MDEQLEKLIASMGGRSADERAAEEEPRQPVSVRSSTDSDVTAAIATFVQWARDSEKVSPAPVLCRERPVNEL